MCSAILVPFLLPQLLERSQYIAPISILGSILLSSLAFIQLAWAAVTISLALGILIGIIQLVVICKIVENSSSGSTGMYTSFVFFAGNTGATIAISGVGLIPENMFSAKIFFITIFFVGSIIGGIAMSLQNKHLSKETD